MAYVRHSCTDCLEFAERCNATFDHASNQLRIDCTEDICRRCVFDVCSAKGWHVFSVSSDAKNIILCKCQPSREEVKQYSQDRKKRLESILDLLGGQSATQGLRRLEILLNISKIQQEHRLLSEDLDHLVRIGDVDFDENTHVFQLSNLKMPL